MACDSLGTVVRHLCTALTSCSSPHRQHLAAVHLQECSYQLEACFARHDKSKLGAVRSRVLPPLLQDAVAWSLFRPYAAVHGEFSDQAARTVWQAAQDSLSAGESAVLELLCDIDGHGTVTLDKLRRVIRQMLTLGPGGGSCADAVALKVAKHVPTVRPPPAVCAVIEARELSDCVEPARLNKCLVIQPRFWGCMSPDPIPSWSHTPTGSPL